MATKINTITSVSLTAIEGTDCLGDTYLFINKNFENLGTFLNRIDTRTTSTPTTLTRALSVYNQNGTYLGYIPIYT